MALQTLMRIVDAQGQTLVAGETKVEGYEDWILLNDGVSIAVDRPGTSADEVIKGEQGGKVMPARIPFSVNGKGAAALLKGAFTNSLKNFGVEIHYVKPKSDGKGNETYLEVKLKDAALYGGAIEGKKGEKSMYSFSIDYRQAEILTKTMDQKTGDTSGNKQEYGFNFREGKAISK